MEIVFLRHTPIDVDLKMYEHFVKISGYRMTVIAEEQFSGVRLSCGYSDRSEYIQTIYEDKSKLSDFYNKVFRNKKDAIFIFNGLGLAKKHEEYIKKYNLNFGIIAEYDNLTYASIFTKLVKKYFTFVQRVRYKDIIKNCGFLLAMGQVGVKCYKRYGFPDLKLYDYMYCEGNSNEDIIYHKEGSKVRFIYVGRFDYNIKGVDIMLDAFDKVKGNYSLDLVGGYGNNSNDVFDRIKDNRHIEYIGTWDNRDVCRNLNNYDVIIVPSKADGWNLHNNFCVKAGIGAITTSNAGSNEIISCCKNGVVIPNSNANKLRKEIQRVIDNPEIINIWKENTVGYRQFISNDSVAEYLLDIINYHYGKSEKRPKTPWLI